LILTAGFGDALVTDPGVVWGSKLELDIERSTFFAGSSGNLLNFLTSELVGRRPVDFETTGFKFAC
jgi:hypothetical protein